MGNKNPSLTFCTAAAFCIESVHTYYSLAVQRVQIVMKQCMTVGVAAVCSDMHCVKLCAHTGNTSMDAGLSLIMANMGGVGKNDIVFDPFVGTGSLLVACAHHGAYVMGTDIDYMLIHAKGGWVVSVQVCMHLYVCVCAFW